MRMIDGDALKQDLTRFYDNEVTAKQLIDEQPTVSGWISVKDRFPEFPCITYDIHGNMDYCKTGIVKMCIDGTWYACTENMVHLEEVLHPNKNTAAMVMGNHITHWMPLPEPQKEDEE